MAIKCSLLGHKFTDTEVEEEREEQGSEVLTTIKEVETCERCGKRRVVSENKEVTSLETSVGGDEDEAASEEPSVGDPDPPSSEPTPAPNMDAAEDDAELIESAEPQPDDAGEVDPATGMADVGSEGVETDEPMSAEDDDAVILDDDDDEDERETGEWPDDEEPDLKGADDDEARANDDEVTDGAESADADAETATQEWPDEYGHEETDASAPEVEWPTDDEDDEDDWEATESLTKKIDGPEVERAGAATVTVPEGEFECPECGFQTSVEASSLRAGDFCPDCHRGSLEHRAEEETRKE